MAEKQLIEISLGSAIHNVVLAAAEAYEEAVKVKKESVREVALIEAATKIFLSTKFCGTYVDAYLMVHEALEEV